MVYPVELLPSSESVLAQLQINLDNLKHTQLSPSQRGHYRAVVNWLTKYKTALDVSNLERVRGYLEAFYHLCEVNAWELAKMLLFTRLNTPTNDELHNQLDT